MTYKQEFNLRYGQPKDQANSLYQIASLSCIDFDRLDKIKKAVAKYPHYYGYEYNRKMTKDMWPTVYIYKYALDYGRKSLDYGNAPLN